MHVYATPYLTCTLPDYTMLDILSYYTILDMHLSLFILYHAWLAHFHVIPYLACGFSYYIILAYGLSYHNMIGMCLFIVYYITIGFVILLLFQNIHCQHYLSLTINTKSVLICFQSFLGPFSPSISPMSKSLLNFRKVGGAGNKILKKLLPKIKAICPISTSVCFFQRKIVFLIFWRHIRS